MEKTLNDNSTNEQILNVHNIIISNKIDEIVSLMNTKINNDKNLKIFDEHLPKYINYVLSMVIKSYPFMNKYINKIIEFINIINNYRFHPLLYHQIITNLIITGHIIEFKNINDKTIFGTLHNIHIETEMIFSIFNDIFISVDEKYKETELFFGYDLLSNLSLFETCKILTDHQNNHNEINNLGSRIKNINMLLIHLDHLNQYEMNEHFESPTLENIKLIDNLFDIEIEMCKTILRFFEDTLISNYKMSNKFNVFKNINISNENILKFSKKNGLYYMNDIIATLNNNILQDLIRRK